jgi:hypothetical protein
MVAVCLLVNSTAVQVVGAQRINLSGDWVSAYTCPTSGVQYPLSVKVVHHRNSIVAVKLLGDRCIEQDNVAVFLGDVSGFSSQMECATYGGVPPSLSYVTDSIQIRDANHFTACQANFNRVGAPPTERSSTSQPPVKAPIRGPSSCSSNQWYSGIYKRCFDKYGRCSQYNFTDTKTCNSGSDRLRCDWDVNNNTCFAE